MFVLRFIKKIFNKDKKPQRQEVSESKDPLEATSSEEKTPSNEDLELQLEPSEVPEKGGFSVEDKKTDHKKYRNLKGKIRVLSDDEDLYELFTGEDNPGIKEPSLFKSEYYEEKQSFKTRYPKPQKKIDLHGLTSNEAERRIFQAISTASMRRLEAIIFITGKGLHSDQGFSVLKDLSEKIAVNLKKKGRIQGYKWEKKKKSKSGAIIYYL